MLGCSCPWFAARFLIVAITESMTSLSLKASAAGAKTATETRRNITPPRAERPEAFPVRAAILSYLASVASVARSQTQQVWEGEGHILAEPASVVCAFYGAPDRNEGADVTEKVRALLAERGKVTASNADFGDPLPGVRKVLFVDTK